VSLAVPTALKIRAVYRLDLGLVALPFSTIGDRVSFSLTEMNSVAVFLLTTKEHLPPTLSLPALDPSFSVHELYRQLDHTVGSLMRPALDPDTPPDTAETVRLGCTVQEAFDQFSRKHEARLASLAMHATWQDMEPEIIGAIGFSVEIQRPATAESLIDTALTLCPPGGRAAWLTKVGDTLRKSGHPQRAARVFERALPLCDDATAAVLCAQGTALCADVLRDYSAAANWALERVRRLATLGEPTDGAALAAAAFLIQAARPQEGLAHLDALPPARHDAREARWLRAQAHDLLDNVEPAIRLYTDIASHDPPRAPSALLGAAELLIRHQQYASADAILRRLAREHPAHAATPQAIAISRRLQDALSRWAAALPHGGGTPAERGSTETPCGSSNR